ncbi:hypothetical protein XBKB1_530003 [Xenorhabdus bovienii str. kraussei Becker Underwood]|uniref:Uncharacterized protein n=1 Tax=Xenorhabdus bovienii str. kraussei Becker Underwood TaxID=1398204 RepID=A0A077PZP7_XENBV|nr:hypothetical protein XBKB1_530003 [Xenorhabdus bovienii str. kraussei Becker Underwood]
MSDLYPNFGFVTYILSSKNVHTLALGFKAWIRMISAISEKGGQLL